MIGVILPAQMIQHADIFLNLCLTT